MRCRVIIVVALASFVACKGDKEPEAGAGAAPATDPMKTPKDLRNTPWGEIVTARTELWTLFEEGNDDPDSLVDRLDSWYQLNGDRLRSACLEASRRPIQEPGVFKKQLDAFSRWQIDIAQPRSDALQKIVRDSRLAERLHLFDHRCLDAASRAAPTNRGAPEDPWARYVSLRKEIHALVGQGISKPGPTLRAGASWYRDHEEEIRATCRRMSALSAAPENEERIAEYTTYLRTVGQRSVEKLIARIPVMVSGPSDASGLFDLMKRFDQICTEATTAGH